MISYIQTVLCFLPRNIYKLVYLLWQVSPNDIYSQLVGAYLRVERDSLQEILSYLLGISIAFFISSFDEIETYTQISFPLNDRSFIKGTTTALLCLMAYTQRTINILFFLKWCNGFY